MGPEQLGGGTPHPTLPDAGGQGSGGGVATMATASEQAPPIEASLTQDSGAMVCRSGGGGARHPRQPGKIQNGTCVRNVHDPMRSSGSLPSSSCKRNTSDNLNLVPSSGSVIGDTAPRAGVSTPFSHLCPSVASPRDGSNDLEDALLARRVSNIPSSDMGSVALSAVGGKWREDTTKNCRREQPVHGHRVQQRSLYLRGIGSPLQTATKQAQGEVRVAKNSRHCGPVATAPGHVAAGARVRMSTALASSRPAIGAATSMNCSTVPTTSASGRDAPMGSELSAAASARCPTTSSCSADVPLEPRASKPASSPEPPPKFVEAKQEIVFSNPTETPEHETSGVPPSRRSSGRRGPRASNASQPTCEYLLDAAADAAAAVAASSSIPHAEVRGRSPGVAREVSRIRVDKKRKGSEERKERRDRERERALQDDDPDDSQDLTVRECARLTGTFS